MPHILIIDDELDSLQQLSRLTQPVTKEITTISSGTQALALIESSNPLPYCVIVLDLVMPEVDGYMILAGLQQRNSQIPVIVSLKQSALQDVHTALRLGAWDFITRPFVTERVQVTVRNAIRHHDHLRTSSGAVLDEKASIRIVDRKGRIQPFDHLEEQILRIAHSHADGHISEMARKLNVGRSTLYRKLKKIGLDSKSGQ